MRGSETMDGKISGNRQLVDRYNEAKGAKPAKGQKKPKETGGESGGAREISGHDEIKQVVAEHGPAHSSHIIDRGEGHDQGRYHVMTHHADGHVHHADHDTMGAAAEHVAHAHEDTEHLGDMPPDDSQVAEEHSAMERGGAQRGTRNVGLMG